MQRPADSLNATQLSHLGRLLRSLLRASPLTDGLEQARRRPPPTRSGCRRAPASECAPGNRTAPAPADADPSPPPRARSPIGTVKSIASYDVGASPASPTVQTPASFSSSIARAMFTTCAILTCAHRAGRRLGRGAAERRRPPALHHDAVDAGGVGRPQDRAEVVRILDAVEHDDQRGPPRAAHQILDAVIGGASSTSATTP